MNGLKKSGGPITAHAGCDNCDWHEKNWKNAQACAASHAKHHKHKTWCEVGMQFTYDGTQ